MKQEGRTHITMDHLKCFQSIANFYYNNPNQNQNQNIQIYVA